MSTATTSRIASTARANGTEPKTDTATESTARRTTENGAGSTTARTAGRRTAGRTAPAPAPLLTDATERALLTAGEHRIADPVPVGPALRAAGAWLWSLIPRDRRVRRMVQLQAGLAVYGVSDGLMLLSALGATPWDVFHQGLARHLGTAVGTMAIIVGALVMLLWIPLRQKPGFGTLSNVVMIGLATNAAMAWIPTPHATWLRWTVLLGAIGLNGAATGLYIGAGMGPGPRDGLMTGYAARGHSIRVVRTGIEITVVASGWLLGGTVGVGTLVYALAIGPLAHRFIPVFALRSDGADGADGTADGSAGGRQRSRDRHRPRGPRRLAGETA